MEQIFYLVICSTLSLWPSRQWEEKEYWDFNPSGLFGFQKMVMQLFFSCSYKVLHTKNIVDSGRIPSRNNLKLKDCICFAYVTRLINGCILRNKSVSRCKFCAPEAFRCRKWKMKNFWASRETKLCSSMFCRNTCMKYFKLNSSILFITRWALIVPPSGAEVLFCYEILLQFTV